MSWSASGVPASCAATKISYWILSSGLTPAKFACSLIASRTLLPAMCSGTILKSAIPDEDDDGDPDDRAERPFAANPVPDGHVLPPAFLHPGGSQRTTRSVRSQRVLEKKCIAPSRTRRTAAPRPANGSAGGRTDQ